MECVGALLGTDARHELGRSQNYLITPAYLHYREQAKQKTKHPAKGVLFFARGLVSYKRSHLLLQSPSVTGTKCHHIEKTTNNREVL